jgi:CubicO group peptidase (beta-lactamase class C family)
MAADFNSLCRVASAAIEDRVIPGLVVAARQGDGAPLELAFGQRQIEPAPLPATLDTVYDLASLTKPLVTSLLVMKAVAQGRLELDQPLGDHLEALRDRPEVTLRRTLSHSSGFPAHRKFYESAFAEGGPLPKHRAAIVAQAAAEPLVYPPGTRSLYSDLGFILLGALVEQVLGARLDVLAAQLLFAPLGLASLRFVPLPRSAAAEAVPVAPTERCPVRGRLVVGEVHDLNAHAMGGVAGHAGLFGNAGDVLRLASALCAAYHGRGQDDAPPLVEAGLLREFWRPALVPGSTWRLGWDGPAATGSLAGALLSRAAVGHLSFTGCSLWIDPDAEASVVVLTNRVHPHVRDDPRFRALRPVVNDEALRAIGYRAR